MQAWAFDIFCSVIIFWLLVASAYDLNMYVIMTLIISAEETSDSHFQRAQALQPAGFFITTDSAFGNSILPVLPRIEK
ncbi:hypothetical protein QTP88_028559 [Uroleucon formosanum]